MQVILDLDGTIIDSTLRHALLLETILQSRKMKYGGFNRSCFLETKCNGYSTKEFCEKILHLPIEDARTVSSLWVENIENSEWLNYDVLYKDALVFFEWNKKKNNTVVFLTARNNKNNLVKELKRLGIDNCAQGVYVVSPFNAMEEKANKLLELVSERGESIFIGDTESDYYAGKKANANTFILNRGFRSKEYLKNIGIESFSSLIEVMEMCDQIV